MSAFESIGTYVKQNGLGIGLLGLGVAGVLTATLASGCSLSDWIDVAVPPPIQKSIGAPAKVSLTQAPYTRTEYTQQYVRTVDQFDNAIDRADAFRDLATDLLNTGITVGSDAIAGSGFPMGGTLALALGGLGGLFLNKPGTSKKLKAAEDAGYDMGQHETERLLRPTVLHTLRGIASPLPAYDASATITQPSIPGYGA